MDLTSSFCVMVRPVVGLLNHPLIISRRDACVDQERLHGRSERAATNRGELLQSVPDES